LGNFSGTEESKAGQVMRTALREAELEARKSKR
jgi:hypothetical protein